MRRFIAMLCGAILLSGSIGAASAAAPIKSVEQFVGLGCDAVATPLGTFYGGAWSSDLFGADAAMEVFSDLDGQPSLVRDWEQPSIVEFTDTTYAADIPLVDRSGNTSTASIAGTFVIVPGTSAQGSDRFRFANRAVRSNSSEEALLVTMTLTLPGVEPIIVDPIQCGGATATVTTFETNPNAFTDRWSARETVCELTNADGDIGFLFLETFGDEVFLEVWGTTAEGDDFTSNYIGPFVGDTLTAELRVFIPGPIFVETDPGTIEITLLETDIDISYYIHHATGFARVRGVALDVEGSATAFGATFDLGHCVGYVRDVKQVGTQPAGPGPGGKRPANDLPAGAQSLKVGDHKAVSTRGATPALEADMSCLTFIEPFTGEEIHAEGGHSVWYKVTGKGAQLTFDTAGSDYDTIVAVYAGAPDAAAEVGCVDDVFFQPIGRTLQSAVTWEAQAGTTYWIQAGGLVGPAYGNLKVALR